MAEEMRDSNEVVIRQTFSIPISKEVGVRFLDNISGNFETEYQKTVSSILSENSEVADLIAMIACDIAETKPPQQVISLVSGMVFGYGLIQESAVARDISIPVINKSDITGLIDDFSGEEMEEVLDREDREVLEKDPVFYKIMSKWIDTFDEMAFYQGAVMIHHVINKKNQDIGIKPGKYGDILVK